MTLTPYETGERLEPELWNVYPVWQPDTYGTGEGWGKVDFDDENATTHATIHGERNEDGTYTIHIRGHVPGLKIKFKEAE